MISNLQMTVLRLVGEHDGEWGWYQYERGCSPGWFVDEPAETRAMDLLNQLEQMALVTAVYGEAQPKYRLTDQGRHVLQQATVDSIPV